MADEKKTYTDEEWRERMAKAEAWECPDCGHKLEACPATEVHSVHQPDDKGRKCTECEFKVFIGKDNNPRPKVGEPGRKPKPVGGREYTKKDEKKKAK